VRDAEIKVRRGVYVDNSAAHLCATSVEQIGNKGTENTETGEQLITGQNGTPEISDIGKKIKKIAQRKGRLKIKRGSKPVKEQMKTLDHIAQLGD
jgi:hypothetical protein